MRRPGLGQRLGEVLRSLPWIPAALVGLCAIPGAWLASFLPAEELRKSLGFLVLVAVSFFMFSGSRKNPPESDSISSQKSQFVGFGIILSSIACGIYGGFIGAGIGAFIILMFTLFSIPNPEPIGAAKGIIETHPISSSSLHNIGSSVQ